MTLLELRMYVLRLWRQNAWSRDTHGVALSQSLTRAKKQAKGEEEKEIQQILDEEPEVCSGCHSRSIAA